jgi:hypothetical protein
VRQYFRTFFMARLAHDGLAGQQFMLWEEGGNW